MSATLFLSLSPLPSNPSHFLPSSNPHSNFYIPISSSMNPDSPKNPKHNHPSNRKSPPFTITTTNSEISSSDPLSLSGPSVKMRMAPWMKGPILLQPNEVLDISKPSTEKSSDNDQCENSDRSLTDRESGGRNKKAMQKIVESIEKFQVKNNSETTQKIFEAFEFDVSLVEDVEDQNSRSGRKMPWSKEERILFRRTKKEKVPTAAELSLDRILLERLRGEAIRMRKWVKVKKAGVTQAVVDEIKLIWRKDELAMVKFYVPLCRNMVRAQEIVEVVFDL